MKFDSTDSLIIDIAEGKMVVLVDDEDRENEGDLICAAQNVTPQQINFMASHGKGLICLAMTPAKCDALNLPMMTNLNRTKNGTAFTVSIEAAEGITTGISAADRAHTITPAGSSLASLAKSHAASVCPALLSTPPERLLMEKHVQVGQYLGAWLRLMML